MGHVQVAKFMIRCSLARSYVRDTRLIVFWTTHLDDKGLLSSNDYAAVLLLQAAERYLTS